MKSVCFLHIGVEIQTPTTSEDNGSWLLASLHYCFIWKDQRVMVLNQKSRTAFTCMGSCQLNLNLCSKFWGQFSTSSDEALCNILSRCFHVYSVLKAHSSHIYIYRNVHIHCIHTHIHSKAEKDVSFEECDVFCWIYGFTTTLIVRKCCIKSTPFNDHFFIRDITLNIKLCIMSKAQQPQWNLTTSPQDIWILYRHKYLGCTFLKSVFLYSCLLCWLPSHWEIIHPSLGSPSLSSAMFFMKGIIISFLFGIPVSWHKLNIQ